MEMILTPFSAAKICSKLIRKNIINYGAAQFE